MLLLKEVTIAIMSPENNTQVSDYLFHYTSTEEDYFSEM